MTASSEPSQKALIFMCVKAQLPMLLRTAVHSVQMPYQSSSPLKPCPRWTASFHKAPITPASGSAPWARSLPGQRPPGPPQGSPRLISCRLCCLEGGPHGGQLRIIPLALLIVRVDDAAAQRLRWAQPGALLPMTP